MAAPTTPDAVMQARSDVRAKRAALIDAIQREADARTTLDTTARTVAEDPTDPENPVLIARALLIQAEQALSEARAAERASRASLASAVATWLKDGASFVSPAVDVQRLDPGLPIIMIPVRLETRFGSGASTLRVRMYPDEI